MAKDYLNDVKKWRDDVKRWTSTESFHSSRLEEDLRSLESEIQKCESQHISSRSFAELQSIMRKINFTIETWSKKRNHTGSVYLMDNTYIPIGKHQLPPLPYAYDALEPYIAKEIMRLHHDKHHLSYVQGLNKAEIQLQQARKDKDFQLVKHWERELAFHGSGHYLHTIFWEVMSPKGSGKPSGPLLKAIEKSFGSYNSFYKQFSEAADAVEGVGWAILVWSPRTRRLEILQSERHMLLTQWDTIPLLVLDVWEHAYYLQYKNMRKDYIRNWWNVVNWDEVEHRYEKAKNLTWQSY
ncbi:superoxide dismutase [Bacillus sp. 2205SS5-2]|uniref:superoxide dismutase n=1 Tax=Bacillus sp. 2205SS5-2 TaxID=3109031 RepID=UPI003003A785